MNATMTVYFYMYISGNGAGLAVPVNADAWCPETTIYGFIFSSSAGYIVLDMITI